MESTHRGHDIVKMVISRFTTPEAWVKSQVNHKGFVLDKMKLERFFTKLSGFSL
jgi:hypothetical protein